LQKFILSVYPELKSSSTLTQIDPEVLFGEWLKSYNKNFDEILIHKTYGIVLYLASNETSIEIEKYVRRMKNKFAYDLVCTEA